MKKNKMIIKEQKAEEKQCIRLVFNSLISYEPIIMCIDL